MGKRGPAKQPESVRILHGTYREDRDGGGVSAPAGVPAKPAWLGGHAAAMWDEQVKLLSAVDGLLAKLDGAALAAFCQAWQVFHESRIAIEENGIEDKHAVVTHMKSIDTICRLAGKFGMTPSDRVDLKLPTKQEAKVIRRQRA